MFRKTVVVCLTTVALALVSSTANAQLKPFKVSGGGPAPIGLSIFGFDSPHSATGNATHLGKYSGDGIANVLSIDLLSGSGTFKGTFTFTAANGDKLACTYGDTANGAEQDGAYQLYDVGGGNIRVVFIAEFNPVPALCTGKFKKVSDGSFLMIAVTEPFPLQHDELGFTPAFNYAWEGEGWLEFAKK
jgi:hypothetical protein